MNCSQQTSQNEEHYEIQDIIDHEPVKGYLVHYFGHAISKSDWVDDDEEGTMKAIWDDKTDEEKQESKEKYERACKMVKSRKPLSSNSRCSAIPLLTEQKLKKLCGAELFMKGKKIMVLCKTNKLVGKDKNCLVAEVETACSSKKYARVSVEWNYQGGLRKQHCSCLAFEKATKQKTKETSDIFCEHIVAALCKRCV